MLKGQGSSDRAAVIVLQCGDFSISSVSWTMFTVV